jgi:hypothetical protein
MTLSARTASIKRFSQANDYGTKTAWSPKSRRVEEFLINLKVHRKSGRILEHSSHGENLFLRKKLARKA